MFEFTVLMSSLPHVTDQTQYMSLNDKPWMIRPTRIDLNYVETKYYTFRFTPDKFSGRCYSGNGLSSKICVPSKTRSILNHLL